MILLTKSLIYIYAKFQWFSIYEPETIGKLVSYFNPKSKLSFNDALFYAGLMIGLKFMNAFYIQNLAIYFQQLGINIKNSLCSLVYRKSRCH